MGKRNNMRLRKMLLYIEYITFCLKRELGFMPDETKTDAERDRLLKWFSWSHLPPHLQATSKQFADVAEWLNDNVPSGPERTVALRKLLEAKDAAVRATITPGG
jgi:hypothetical protein